MPPRDFWQETIDERLERQKRIQEFKSTPKKTSAIKKEHVKDIVEEIADQSHFQDIKDKVSETSSSFSEWFIDRQSSYVNTKENHRKRGVLSFCNNSLNKEQEARGAIHPKRVWEAYQYHCVCNDGTISVRDVSPYIKNHNPAEGTCGAIALSNIAANLCGSAIDPIYSKFLPKDPLPGTSPITLKASLENYFTTLGPKFKVCSIPKNWEIKHYNDGRTYILELQKALNLCKGYRTPNHRCVIPTLQFFGGLEMHWTTVVDIQMKVDPKTKLKSCHVYHLDEGIKRDTLCSAFGELAYAPYDILDYGYEGVKSYTFIRPALPKKIIKKKTKPSTNR